MLIWFFYDISFYDIPKILWRLTYFGPLYDVWRKKILGTYLLSHLLWRSNLRNRWSGWPQATDLTAWQPPEVEPTPKNLIFENFTPIWAPILKWGVYQVIKTNRFVTYLFYDISFYDAEISSGLTYIFFMTCDARWPLGTYLLIFIKKSNQHST